MNISQLWASASITATGEDKSDQMLSLQKKIFKHKESSAHQAALSILETAKTKSLETVCTKAFENEKGVTANIFRTAHKVVKKNQAFYDYEAEIDVQELNGINMGRILHSTNGCVNIVNHIAVEMKSTVIKNIIEWNNNIALLIDESTTISQLSSLIIYLRTTFPDMNEPTNLFLDITELKDVTSEGIFKSLMTRLTELGFHDDFLKENILAIATDGLQ